MEMKISIVNEIFVNRVQHPRDCLHKRFSYKNFMKNINSAQCYDCGSYFNLQHPENKILKKELLNKGYDNENPT
jgi:hypothetical protein